MKKAFAVFALFVFITSVISCSKSSNPDSPVATKQLVLTANQTVVNEGEAVSFSVKVGDQILTDATLLIDQQSISNPFVFAKAGSYKVIAKKENYNNSNEIVIEVKEPTSIEKKLTLQASRTTIKIGEKVIFNVQDEENQEVLDAVITSNGTSVGASWEATTAGSFKFIAAKIGYVDSPEISVLVEEETGLSNYFMYKEQRYDVTQAKLTRLGEKLGAGGKYDVYLVTLNNEGAKRKNVLQFNIEIKSTDPYITALPQNGKFAITPYDLLAITIHSTEIADQHAENTSYANLSDIYLTETEDPDIEIIKNGTINFHIETMDHEIIKGQFSGEMVVKLNKY